MQGADGSAGGEGCGRDARAQQPGVGGDSAGSRSERRSRRLWVHRGLGRGAGCWERGDAA